MNPRDPSPRPRPGRVSTFAALLLPLVLVAACGGGAEGGDGAPSAPSSPTSPTSPTTPVPPTAPGTPVPGDPTSPAPPSTPDAQATAVGQPRGSVVSARIGPAGGTLRSADGLLVVEVPAGALAAERTLTLQPISNEVHGAPGAAWRLAPADLAPAQPLTLRFSYGDADLQGSAASEQRAAVQDAQQRWQLADGPQLDPAARTLTVRSTRTGDWARFSRTWLSPAAATVKPGQQVALKVVRCEAATNAPNLLQFCTPAPDTKTMGPQVNGTSGGGATVGVVMRPNADRAEYTYTAPARAPNPRTVAVSVQTLESAPGSGAATQLVSNITIDDTEGCAWVKDVSAFEYEVYARRFTAQAAGDHVAYTGSAELAVWGRMKPVNPGAEVVVFNSAGQEYDGRVDLEGTMHVTLPDQVYTQHYQAGAKPDSGASLVWPVKLVLVIDTRSCTYAFSGGAIVMTDVVGGPGGGTSTPVSPLEMHFKDVPLPLAANTSHTIVMDPVDVPLALDTDPVNGVMPWAGMLPMDVKPGTARVGWLLRGR